MPWKECSVMDERLQFVARRLAGEAMAELCRKFGISRKTGYKIFDRYQECSLINVSRSWRSISSRRAFNSSDFFTNLNLRILALIRAGPRIARRVIDMLD